MISSENRSRKSDKDHDTSDKQLHLHRVAVKGAAPVEVQATITTIIMTICTSDSAAGVTLVAIITNTTVQRTEDVPRIAVAVIVAMA
jgi:hypothetical protein